MLANVAPWVLRILMGEGEDPETKPQGAQLKINLLLDRLPELRSGVDPRVAFAGTLHVAEDYTQLRDGVRRRRGRPGADAWCRARSTATRSPTPRSSATRPTGMHTLTYFGLHTPAALFEQDRETHKAEAVARALAALDEHLVEPIASCVATDAAGRPCIEAKVPQDVEADLAMPGGHIFHGDLDWPWASNRARLETPAQQWGVQTDHASVLVCGSGARRGGAVSGLGGHNAAQAVLGSR